MNAPPSIEIRFLSSRFWLLALAAWLPASPAIQAQTNYMAGHADLSVRYTDGDWNVHYRFGPDTVLNGSLTTLTSVPPANIHVIVPNNAATRFILNASQASGAYSFLGTTAGHTNWYSQQNNVAGEPYFGLGSDELDYNSFTGAVTFKLVSFSGPGHFSAWQSDQFGNPVVAFDTADGLGSDDVVAFSIPTHAHYNWGFTEPGEYVVGVAVTATNKTDGVLSSTNNIVFEVAPFAVPLLGIQTGPLGNLTVSLPTVPSQLYQFQSATNLTGPWANLGTQFTGSGLTNQLTRTNALGQEFFRIKTQQ